MLLNVEWLTDEQLTKLGLPPNPAGWNAFCTITEQYCDAFWAIPFIDTFDPDKLAGLEPYLSEKYRRKYVP